MKKRLFQSLRTDKEPSFFEQARIEQEIHTFLTKAMVRYRQSGQLLDEEELAYFSGFKYRYPLNLKQRLLLFRSKLAIGGRRLQPAAWSLRYVLAVSTILLLAGWVGGQWLLDQYSAWQNRSQALITPSEKIATTPELSAKEIPSSPLPASVPIPSPETPATKAAPDSPAALPTPALVKTPVEAPPPPPPVADHRVDLGNGFFSVQVDGKWGLRNPNGKMVLAARYDRIQRFGPGDAFFRIESGGKTGIANTAGEVVIHPFFDDVPQYFFNADLFVVTKDGRQNVYDRRRQRFIPGLDFSEISCYSEGRFCVRLDNGRWTFVDALGRPVVSDTYEAILQPFRQGRARVRLNGQELNIDQAGEEVAMVK